MSDSNAVTVMNEAPLPVVQDDASKIMDIISAAAARGELNTVEKMMDLRDRELARIAKVEFDRDFVQMKPHLPVVLRSKKNTQTNSNYAPLEDINRVVDPILAQYGFGVSSPIVAQSMESVTVEAILAHRSGHSIRNSITLPLDKTGIAGKVNKTDVHAIASTIMYCRRLATCALLNISTGNDVDGNRPTQNDDVELAYITPEQAMQIDLDLKEVGIDREQFFGWAKTYNEDGEPVADSRFILAKNLKKVQGVIDERRADNAKAKKAGKA